MRLRFDSKPTVVEAPKAEAPQKPQPPVAGKVTLVDPFSQGGALFAETHVLVESEGGGNAIELRQQNVEVARGYGAKFQRALDDATISTNRSGNTAELLPDGVSSFAQRTKLIKEAKHSVLLQTFIFNDDETGWETAKLLAEKAKQGVKCCVIFDGVGSNRADGEIFEFMKKAGVEVREYAPLRSQPHLINQRWHEKMLVVDGHTAITGGMNIADEYAFGGSARMVLRHDKKETLAWRDMDIVVSGPIVKDMAMRFSLNWGRTGESFAESFERQLVDRAPPPRLKGGKALRLLTNEAGDSKSTDINKAYLLAIQSAQKSITIENPYFLPKKEIRQALIDAQKRGVEVKIMTNSAEVNDVPLLSDISRHYYDELVAAGITVYEKHGGTLHAKTASFDGEFAIVGSANLNRRSNGLDSEGVLCISDGQTAKALDKRFLAGLHECKEITARELAAEDWLTNLKQWACSLIARFF